MASNREERFLMRQRGAGARELRDSGFSLNLSSAASTPVQPPRQHATPKSQRTPKSTPRTYSRKTPRSTRQRKSASVLRSISPIAEVTQEDDGGSARKKRRLVTPIDTITEEPERRSQRRAEAAGNVRDSSDLGEETNTIPGEASATSPIVQLPVSSGTSPASKRKKRKSIGQRQKKRQHTNSISSQYEILRDESTNAQYEEDVGLVEDGSEQDLGEELESQATQKFASTPSQGRKLRSIGQSSSTKQKQRRVSLRTAPGPTSVGDDEDDTPTTLKKPARLSAKGASELRNIIADHYSEGTREAPVTAKKRGRPRKSDAGAQSTVSNTKPTHNVTTRVVATPSKSPIDTRTSPRNVVASATLQESVTPTRARGKQSKSTARHSQARIEGEEEEEEEGTSKKIKPSQAKSATAQNPSADITRVADRNRKKAKSQQEGEASDHVTPLARPRGRPRKSDLSQQDIQPKTSQPAPTKGGRKARNSGNAIVSKSSNKRKQRPTEEATPPTESVRQKAQRESIPVLVHRFSHPRALNFVDLEEDDLAGPAPLLKKAGVNAVDVLAQICREIVARSIETCTTRSQAEQGGKRAEWKRKRKIIELFDESLQSRLLQLTTAVDHNIGLAMKLKQVNRAKAKYREELIALRQEREDIAIEMDQVRMKHDNTTASVKGTNDLTTDLHDIELAVQRGRDAQQVANDNQPEELGLEARLQQITDIVSSANGQQGLLEKVRSYNAYLETAVGLL